MIVKAVALLIAMSFLVPTINAEAVVAKDISCFMLDGFGVLSISTTDSQAVQSASGNSKITCTADNVPTPGPKAIKWNYANTGLLCSTSFGFTTDWEEVVTPSGHATLSCHINPNPPP